MSLFKVDSKIEINIDPEKMKDVSDEKIERVIGQILVRFIRWNCDKLTIFSEGDNNLFCQFWLEDKVKVTMGAIWRNNENEFTFHT